MQELKIVELRRTESNSKLDQSEDSSTNQSEMSKENNSPNQFAEVDLGTLNLPLDLDLETNRSKIENYLRNPVYESYSMSHI